MLKGIKDKYVLFVLGIFILGTTLPAPQAHAQVLYGSLVGTVSDPSSAAVPQATVRIVNEATGVVRQASTNSKGGYSFPSLPAGTYDVTVSKQGFKAYTFKGADVSIDQTARVNVSLQLGAVTQTVEVTSQRPMLQTESAQVRGDINSTTLRSIPVPIDSNYESLLITVPGVSPPDNAHSYAANPSRGLIFDVNGTTANSNDVRIDGVSANNLWLPHVVAYVPSRHAIQTVSVVTNSFNVAQGVVGGAAINVHVKSGTNHIHGSLYEGNMNNGLEADPFAFRPPPPGQKRPKLINNDFGGTVGGPIITDKLFYFGSYEGILLRQGAQALVTLPTSAMREGDLSASPTPIYDPATGNPDGSGRTQFIASSDPASPDYNSACTNTAGCPNIIPTNRLDATALQIQKLLVPATNESGLTNNYFASGPFKSNRHTIDSKVNWNVNNKLRLNGRFGLLHYTMFNAPILGNNGDAVSSTGYRTENAYGNVYDVTFSGSYIARPNFVINSYFGIDFLNSYSDPPGMNVNQGLVTLKIPGTNGPTPDYGGWPSFRVSDYTPFGSGGSSHSDPIRYNDRTYVWSGNANWVKGTHTVGFGGQIIRQTLNHFELGNSTGTFSFNGGVTTLNGPGAPSTNQFNTYASFLLGLPASASKDFNPFNNGRDILHMWQYSAFVQDQWQIQPNLTLDYGVSWNYFPIGSRNNRGLERYFPDTNQVMLCGVGGSPMNCGYNISKANFSPAMGIAYRATPTFVVRAGFGFSYDPEPLAYIRDMIGNYPETLSLTVSSPNSYSAEGPLSAGIPAISVPDISSGKVILPPQYGTTTLTTDYHRDYVESWNFTLEKELPAGWVAQAGYVATRQVKVPGLLNLNVGQVGGGTASEPFNILYGNTNAIRLETPVNHIHYDSLQTRVSHRFAKGYQLGISYTLSKTIGYCCNQLADGGPEIHLPQYFGLNRSLEPWDRTHDFVVSMVAELPFGASHRWLNSGWSSKVAGGWQANALFSAYSGTPFNVTASGTSLDAPGNVQRADLLGSGPVATLGNIGPGQKYFDTSRFAPVTDVRFGTAGFDILRAPSAAGLDFSLFRKFRVTERFNLQFRAEAFNVTNTPHFNAPNGNRNSGSFGEVSSTKAVGREGIDQRIFRLGMQLNF